MTGFNEETLETTVPPWAQRALGILLLLVTILALWYAVTTLLEGQTPRSYDPQWWSVVLLAAIPFLLLLSGRLIVGKMAPTELFPPTALIVIGVLLLVGTVAYYLWATSHRLSSGRAPLAGVLLGVWSVRIGLKKRAIRKRPEHDA
jgi:protein-S-isoprenylcysteine O-methyltransferase Ste14